MKSQIVLIVLLIGAVLGSGVGVVYTHHTNRPTTPTGSFLCDCKNCRRNEITLKSSGNRCNWNKALWLRMPWWKRWREGG